MSDIRPASTVLLLRDGPRKPPLEVFMVKRHGDIDFAGNALVFPGGKVDGADRNGVMREVAIGVEDLSDEDVAFRACAIRETFEETGVLLAVDEDGLFPASDNRLAHAQQHLNEGDFGFIDLLDSFQLKMAFDQLVPFARWIAPKFAPKRFDTWFYLCRLPPDQNPVHDGGETTDSLWVRPNDAVGMAEAREATIIFPTRMNLMKLGQADTLTGAFMHARNADIVPIEPWIEERDGVKVLTIPSNAGYPVTEELLSSAISSVASSSVRE